MTEERYQEQEDERQEQIDEIRRMVGDGIAFVQSVAYADHLQELTFTACLARAITTIEEDESDIRPGIINGLNALKTNVQTAVDRAKELPGELFEVGSDAEEEEGEEET